MRFEKYHEFWKRGTDSSRKDPGKRAFPHILVHNDIFMGPKLNLIKFVVTDGISYSDICQIIATLYK